MRERWKKGKIFSAIADAGGAAVAYIDPDDPDGATRIRFRMGTKTTRCVNYDALSVLMQELKVKAPELAQKIQDCFTSTVTDTVDVREVRSGKIKK